MDLTRNNILYYLYFCTAVLCYAHHVDIRIMRLIFMQIWSTANASKGIFVGPVASYAFYGIPGPRRLTGRMAAE